MGSFQQKVVFLLEKASKMDRTSYTIETIVEENRIVVNNDLDRYGNEEMSGDEIEIPASVAGSSRTTVFPQKLTAQVQHYFLRNYFLLSA